MDTSLLASSYTNMDKGLLIRSLVMIDISFCFARGLTAFLITCGGYMRGEKPNERLAPRIALQTTLVALAVFAVVATAPGFVLARTIVQ
jgi:hypothetical protein